MRSPAVGAPRSGSRQTDRKITDVAGDRIGVAATIAGRGLGFSAGSGPDPVDGENGAALGPGTATTAMRPER